jgi:Rod binding domain-containing protein
MDVSAISSTNPAAAALAAAMPSRASGGSQPSPVTAAQRHKAAQQFEAILVRQMLSQSVGSMMGGEGHTAGLMYGDLMTNVLAQNLTEGKGLGLGKMIETQLTPRAAPKVAGPPIQRP